MVGSDIAGTVDKIGENVNNWAIGDRVAGLLQGGTIIIEIHWSSNGTDLKLTGSHLWQ